jgi:Multiple myeloma tumor-associated
MDLLTTVRKEGSRGGRGDFKWSDVQSSGHRENYLGHSLMAPVGRWQKGRDLNWYAKGDAQDGDGETSEEKAARERKEEIKRIKEAEQDALARALGYDVPPGNPNMETLGDRKEVDKILKEAAEDDGGEIGKGVGFGKYTAQGGESEERIQGTDGVDRRGGLERPNEKRHRNDKTRDRSRDRRRRSRSRSRDRDRHRRKRRRYDDDDRRRSPSRSRERVRRWHSRSRERYQGRDDREKRTHRRSRSRSPYYGDRDRRRDDYYDRRR